MPALTLRPSQSLQPRTSGLFSGGDASAVPAEADQEPATVTALPPPDNAAELGPMKLISRNNRPASILMVREGVCKSVRECA